MKKLSLILPLLIAISAAAQIKIPTTNSSVKFSWLSDTSHHRTEPYAAMLIPVKLNGCPNPFYMQFDLGAPHTILYSQETKSIISQYPQTDTGTFTIAKTKTKNNRKAQTIIGTIGEDLIDGKKLLIDYPRQTLTITDTLPVTISSTVIWSPFMLMRGSILFQAVLHNKQTILFFDTGSSAFELLTSKATAEQLKTPNTTTATYPVNSWGKTLTANTSPIADSLSIANQQLLIHNVTFIEGASDSQVQQMLKLGIGGMIGNKLFLNQTLIIDTKNKKFAVISEERVPAR